MDILGHRINGKQKRAVIWAGYPLSGKDTHANPYEEIGFDIFRTGDVLKDMAAKDPKNKIYEPIRRRALVDSSLVMWAAKNWIFRRRKCPMIHLNGMPRKVDQLPILSFLKDRGFYPMYVWFSTPKEVCMSRPSRPGREHEDSPENRTLGMETFDNETLPTLQLIQDEYGIRKENGNLLLIDNTELSKAETCAQILRFLDLPFSPDELFPKEKREPAKAKAPKEYFSRPSMTPVRISA